jgi:tRNA modification GTPase
MRNLSEETIAAVATPSGVGAVSIIRVSGPQSFSAVDSIFIGKTKISSAQSHTIHYGKIADSENIFIDDVLVSVFHKPNSYTGEDSIEINTHGNPLICKKIIELLLDKGVRLAEPGEFTKRAFLNNKIDLAQAEAVVDVINSRTDASLRGARNQLDGILSKKVQELRNSLIDASSFVELELDFAEEDLEFVNRQDLLNKINSIIQKIEKLLETYSFGKTLKEGINVALVGKPNVGKSSLLNYILKESRAIVSHIPGTTRDIIREDVSIDGILFRMYDTAGIRQSHDEIEKEGVERSREAVRNSDIVLLIDDVVQNGSLEIYNEVMNLSSNQKVIKVLNKIDLITDYKKKNADIFISALTGDGINTLFEKLKDTAFGSSNYSEKSAIVSNIRHFQCLKEAKNHLLNSLKSIEEKLSGEFISLDLRTAANSLGEIIGEVTSEDILNNIFMKFCIGK